MASSLSSCALASFAGLGLVLASASAHAQVPAPAPAAPAAPPPAYTPPPAYPLGGYAPGAYPPPGAYAPYAGPAPAWPTTAPAFETKRRSSAMLGAGIALLAIGGTGMIIGSSMFAAGNQMDFSDVPFCFDVPCPDAPAVSVDNGLKNGGIAVLVISIAAVVAGVPLTVIGSQKVRVKTDEAALVPEVRGSALLWRFQ